MKSLDSNHARLAAIKDRKTLDIFSSEFGREMGVTPEELTLLGETVPDVGTFAERCERAAADLRREEPEQGGLF